MGICRSGYIGASKGAIIRLDQDYHELKSSPPSHSFELAPPSQPSVLQRVLRGLFGWFGYRRGSPERQVITPNNAERGGLSHPFRVETPTPVHVDLVDTSIPNTLADIPVPAPHFNSPTQPWNRDTTYLGDIGSLDDNVLDISRCARLPTASHELSTQLAHGASTTQSASPQEDPTLRGYLYRLVTPGRPQLKVTRITVEDTRHMKDRVEITPQLLPWGVYAYMVPADFKDTVRQGTALRFAGHLEGTWVACELCWTRRINPNNVIAVVRMKEYARQEQANIAFPLQYVQMEGPEELVNRYANMLAERGVSYYPPTNASSLPTPLYYASSPWNTTFNW